MTQWQADVGRIILFYKLLLQPVMLGLSLGLGPESQVLGLGLDLGPRLGLVLLGLALALSTSLVATDWPRLEQSRPWLENVVKS